MPEIEESEEMVLIRLKALARTVQNNAQFAKIVKSAQPSYRRAVYDQLAPLLRFKAKPYWLLVL